MYKIKQIKSTSIIKTLLVSLTIISLGLSVAYIDKKVKESKLIIDNRFEKCYDGCSSDELQTFEDALEVEEYIERQRLIKLTEAEEERVTEARLEEKRIAHVEKLRQEELARIEAERVRLVEIKRIADEKAEQVRLAENKRIADEKAETERLAKVEQEKLDKERTKRREEKKNEVAIVSRGDSHKGQWMNFEASYYTAGCYKCSGIGASGVDLRQSTYYQGMRVVATDPRVIPLWSIVEVNSNGNVYTAIALDTGGKIKNQIIDVLVGSKDEAYANGRHSVQVRVIRRGK